MMIEIHIFPDHFPIDPLSWQSAMDDLGVRIHRHVMNATINSKSYALGKTTLLANDDSGIIIATIDIRRD